MKNYTVEEKGRALSNAQRSLDARRQYSLTLRRNSFAAWGNKRCVARLIDTIRAMQEDKASPRQYQYWLKH